jgi:membrane protein
MNVIKKTYKEIQSFVQTLNQNSVAAYSAQTAFFIITSFFPFMLLLMTLIKHTPLESHIKQALEGDFMNSVAGEFLSRILEEITARATPGTLLGVAGISALWAASRCILSVIQGLDKVYECHNQAGEKKGWFKLRLVSVVYLLALMAMFIVALGILVLGEYVLQGLSDLVIALRWAVGFLLLTTVFTLSYTFVPQRKTRLLRELPGAVLSTAGWLGFSWLFSMYIDNFADFGAVYGSLAAAVALMLWLYFCMFILFFGAQFNVWLSRFLLRCRE